MNDLTDSELKDILITTDGRGKATKEAALLLLLRRERARVRERIGRIAVSVYAQATRQSGPAAKEAQESEVRQLLNLEGECSCVSAANPSPDCPVHGFATFDVKPPPPTKQSERRKVAFIGKPGVEVHSLFCDCGLCGPESRAVVVEGIIAYNEPLKPTEPKPPRVEVVREDSGHSFTEGGVVPKDAHIVVGGSALDTIRTVLEKELMRPGLIRRV